MRWFYADGHRLRRRVNFLVRGYADALMHAVEPMLATLGEYSLTVFYADASDQPGLQLSRSRALIDAWLLAVDDDSDIDREAVYLRCLLVCVGYDPLGDEPDEYVRRSLLLALSSLSADRYASASIVATVLERLCASPRFPALRLSTAVAECVLAALYRDPTDVETQRLTAILARQESPEPSLLHRLHTRLTDLSHSPPAAD
jgi:hypothetical protein